MEIPKPISKTKLPIKWKGNSVMQLKYEGKFKKSEIKTISQELSNSMKNNNFNGQIMTSLAYPEGWRSGYFSNVGDRIGLYDHTDSNDIQVEPTNFTNFRIYVVKNPVPSGGCSSKYNDCLFKCLAETLFDKNPFKSNRDLKTYLKLDECDLVNIDLIQKIEKKLKTHKINVSGDHIYSSVKNAKFEINLKLINSHYSIKKNDSVALRGIAFEEKKPLFYKNIEQNTEVLVFNGQQQKTINKEMFKNIRSKPRSSEYLLIPCDEKSTLQESYESFINDADILKEATNGLVNLYKTGTFSKTALYLFNHFNQTIQADHIDQIEAQWIENSKFGAMIWSENYTGPAYKYDYCSMYPSILNSEKLLIPIKKGEFLNIKQSDFETMKFLYFGIYHCIVHKSLNNDKNKLFRFNKKNYYTNIDLTRAKELGLAIELFDDGKPNLLHYPRNKTINSSQIFKNYVSLLFALKQKGITKSKQLLNILWGSLSQKNEFSAIVNEDQDDDFVLEDDRSITYLAPLNEKNCFLKYVKNDNYYETNWARLAPFLLAKGRCLISKTIEPFIKNVKRVHTDGFIIDKKVTLKTGNGLGDLKYEGFCPEVYVKNNIRIEGDFKMV